MEELKKIIIDDCGKEYVFQGGSDSIQPGPDSVGSEQIKNKGVKMEDLDDEIIAGLNELDNVETIGTDAAKKMVSDAIGETQTNPQTPAE